MGQRAEALASRIETICADAERTIQECPGEQWEAITKAEGWPVAVTAHHIAGGVGVIYGIAELVATGGDLPSLTLEQLDQANAEHAHQFADVSKDATLALLREGATAAVNGVRAMSDEQLDRTGAVLSGGDQMSTEQVLENILKGTTAGHLESIRATV